MGITTGLRCSIVWTGLSCAAVAGARAESDEAATDTRRAAVVSAHLDFRITVLPNLSVTPRAGQVRIQSGTGALATTRGQSTTWQTIQRGASRPGLAWAVGDGPSWTVSMP
jgi:ribosomal protein L16/L10AE